MKAGLGLNAYRFRGRNFNRAKRGDFKQSMELVFCFEFLVGGVFNSRKRVAGKFFGGVGVPLHLLQWFYKLFIMRKKILAIGKFVKRV